MNSHRSRQEWKLNTYNSSTGEAEEQDYLLQGSGQWGYT